MRLADLRLADPVVDPSQRGRTALIKPVALLPVEVYFVLRSVLGAPNARGDKSKTQWAWYIAVRDCYLFVYDWHISSWSVAVYDDRCRGIAPIGQESEEAIELATEFVDLLRKQAPQEPGHQSRPRPS